MLQCVFLILFGRDGALYLCDVGQARVALSVPFVPTCPSPQQALNEHSFLLYAHFHDLFSAVPSFEEEDMRKNNPNFPKCAWISSTVFWV